MSKGYTQLCCFPPLANEMLNLFESLLEALRGVMLALSLLIQRIEILPRNKVGNVGLRSGDRWTRQDSLTVREISHRTFRTSQLCASLPGSKGLIEENGLYGRASCSMKGSGVSTALHMRSARGLRPIRGAVLAAWLRMRHGSYFLSVTSHAGKRSLSGLSNLADVCRKFEPGERRG